MDDNPEPIRILIADDHTIVRDGLRAVLATQADINVIAEAANGQEAVSKTLSYQPDVVLMDIIMPQMDGIEAIRQIKRQRPETRILVLTSFATDDKVFPAIKAGAVGYLLKDTDSEDLIRAIYQVHSGESSLHPKIARKLLGELVEEPPSPSVGPEVDPLTERELEVLKLVARGLSNEQIAAQLIISEGTVRTHVSNILGKLHLASRTQATLYALRKGIASLDDSSDDA
ncbi:MAG: response regulator transcription factor [Anaerolineales bacterium]|jgi:NarL family two-component system response regulator LiaR